MRKPTKIEIILLSCFMYCTIASIVTVPLMYRAYQIRGQFALGGEVLPVLMIPIVLFLTWIAYMNNER